MKKLTFGQKLMGLREEHLGIKLGDTLYCVEVHEPHKRQGEYWHRFEVALNRGTIIQIFGEDFKFTYRCDEVMFLVQGNYERVMHEPPFFVAGHNYGAYGRNMYFDKENAIHAFKSALLGIKMSFEAIEAAQPSNQLAEVKKKLASLPL